eukprot:495531_1
MAVFFSTKHMILLFTYITLYLCDGQYFNCTGDYKCLDQIMHCNSLNSTDCIIECIGEFACWNATIYGANSNLFVNSSGVVSSLGSANIECPQNKYCNITANGQASLFLATINGTQGSKVFIKAYGEWVMRKAIIDCPMDTEPGTKYSNDAICAITVGGLCSMENLKIYANEGFKNVQMKGIHCEGNGSCIDTEWPPYLYCGQSLDTACVLEMSTDSNSLICNDAKHICNGILPTPTPTISPTLEPTTLLTISPSFSPTKYDGEILCEKNSFNLLSSSSCYECDKNADGYECNGNGIQIEAAYWVALKTNDKLIPLSRVSDVIANDNYNISISIMSLRCPTGICCDNLSGCDGLPAGRNQTSNSGSRRVCAAGRNVSSLICSSCDAGLYEMVGTHNCDTCSGNNYRYIFFLFVLSMIVTFFITFIFSRPYIALEDMCNSKELDWRRLLLKDESDIIRLLIFKVTFYFYQSLTQILSTTKFTITPLSKLESLLLTISNLEISGYGLYGVSGICIVGNIEYGLHKVLLSYLFYAFLLFNFLVFAILSYIFKEKCTLKNMLCNCFGLNKLSQSKAYIKTAFINVIMICTGPLLALSFKLLNCTVIDGEHYHFYDATKQCYGWIWNFGLITIIFTSLILTVMLYSVFKQSTAQRENEYNEYRSLVNKYKSNVWWWEFCLFFRRFGIVILTSFTYMSSGITSVVLISFIVILFGAQIKFDPFKYKRANIMDAICLFGLISIIVCLNFIETQNGAKYKLFLDIYLSFLVLSPFILISILCIRISYRWLYFRRHTNIDFGKETAALERIVERIPMSYTKWFEEQIQIQTQIQIQMKNVNDNKNQSNTDNNTPKVDDNKKITDVDIAVEIMQNQVTDNDNDIEIKETVVELIMTSVDGQKECSESSDSNGALGSTDSGSKKLENMNASANVNGNKNVIIEEVIFTT